MIEALYQALIDILTLQNLLFLSLGVIFGTVMGAVPGLTSAMAIALLIPVTYTLPPITAIVMLLGAYKGGCYGGSVPAILIGTPGTPAAVATVDDGYSLAKQGKGGKALRTALLSSVVGDSISDIVLILAAAQLARVALQFGPPEFTVLIIFALTMVSAAATGSILKGLISACIGMMVAMIGVDPITGRSRLAFDSLELSSGLELVPVLIGLMAISEVMYQVEKRKTAAQKVHLPPPKTPADSRLSFREMLLVIPTIVRSAFMGIMIGVIPGMGPTVGAYMSYTVARNSDKNPEDFGKGSLKGIAAAESGNNAVSGANMIPLLGLGIPGDVLAAVIIGAFMLHDITPGPRIFVNQPEIVYGIFIGLLLANILLFTYVYPFIRAFARLAEIKTSILFPCILIFCAVGSYGFNQRVSDIIIMFVFGGLGYLLRKFEFPLSTLIIGFILLPMFERSFRQSMLISQGSLDILFHSPVSLLFWGLAIISVGIFTLYPYMKTRKMKKQRGDCSDGDK